jgi:Na+-transporting methylmalonyl-CoA/oxaloacetate decarboxylase gamma subunit
MKVVLLLLSIVAFIVITSKISRFLSKRVQSIEKEIEEENKRNENFKEVLKKENCSSTGKPKDINDIQNLTKFNHGTYRDEKGRFKSKKELEWKKEQKTS